MATPILSNMRSNSRSIQAIQETLCKTHLDADVPQEVRRRALEAPLRAPQDWHRDAIRAVFNSGDEAWQLTATFCNALRARFRGGDPRGAGENPDIHYEAVCAAGNWEVVPMIARAEVPEHIVEAIERAWPDGVVEMIDLGGAPFWDTYPALKARLSRISGSDLVYEREPEGGPRWDEGSNPHEDPPDWSEPTRFYHLFFLSPSDRRCSFGTETVEPDQDGVERCFEGEGRVGHTIAVSLAAPFALVALNQYETFENGSRSEPGIELQVFDLEGRRLDAERHCLDLFGEESMRILAEQHDGIARILKEHGLSVLPDEHLDTPLPWLRAGEDLLQGSTGEPLTVRDAFFFETV